MYSRAFSLELRLHSELLVFTLHCPVNVRRDEGHIVVVWSSFSIEDSNLATHIFEDFALEGRFGCRQSRAVELVSFGFAICSRSSWLLIWERVPKSKPIRRQPR